jgi:putative endonuclease
VNDGIEAERRAAAALIAEGYTIVDTNWRCDAGELDIVAREGSVLAFVEVRSRSSDEYGHASEMIGGRKKSRVVRAAKVYVAIEKPIEPELRFDVVAVTGEAIEIIRDAWRL